PDSLVTVKVEDRPFREVMGTLLAQVSARFLQQGNILYIGSTADIMARRDRLPTVTRTFAPKYLTYDQLVKLLNIRYAFDSDATTRLKGIVKDPRDPGRLMVLGTEEEVADWISAMEHWDVPETGEE